MTGHTPHNVHADSADFIRALGPVTKQGLALSQLDASRIRQGIAAAIGISDAKLAHQLSKAQRAKSQADIDAETTRLIQAMQSH